MTQIRTGTAFLVAILTICPAGRADDLTAAELFPDTTAAFVEFPDPGAVVSLVLEHPLAGRLESLDIWKQMTSQQPYRNFIAGRTMFEIQMGKAWRLAVSELSAGGIAAGFDAATQGFAVVMRGADADIMETFRVKLLELTRLNPQLTPGEYRGLTTYPLNADHAGAAVTGEWLVVTNKPALGKAILDRLLDGTRDRESLASNSAYQAARARRSPESTLWGFVNLETVRQADNIRNTLESQTENPGAELILGGIQSALRQSPWLTGEFTLNQSAVRLSFASPLEADWIPEERQWFFGPGNSGRAPQLPAVPETLLTVSAWRDVSEMWLRAGDLFDENMNDQLAEADSNLTTLFAGKDFGEDILGSFEPEIGFVAARQDFDGIRPSPAIRLPSFALVLKMREPETMTRELRRTFQSMIGFFNVIGAMEGRPQLEMDMEESGTARFVTSTYIPEDDERDATQAGIIYNFSPTIAFVGERCVISSSASLARSVVANANATTVVAEAANTAVALDAAVLRSVLTDNREQLISQNMLEEGHTRDEAETQIDLLLTLLGHVNSGSLSLSTADSGLQLSVGVTLAEFDQ